MSRKSRQSGGLYNKDQLSNEQRLYFPHKEPGSETNLLSFVQYGFFMYTHNWQDYLAPYLPFRTLAQSLQLYKHSYTRQPKPSINTKQTRATTGSRNTMSKYTSQRGRAFTTSEDTGRSVRREPVPQDRFSTASEQFFDFEPETPNLFRSNARAGNGKKKRDDSERPPGAKNDVADSRTPPQMRKKSSTLSFVGQEYFNRSERSLEGQDPNSYASRMAQARKNGLRHSRPMSVINEDLSNYAGTPPPMLPSNARARAHNPIPGHRWRDNDDDVRLSRFYGQGDLLGLEGLPENIHDDWTSKQKQRDLKGTLQNLRRGGR